MNAPDTAPRADAEGVVKAMAVAATDELAIEWDLLPEEPSFDGDITQDDWLRAMRAALAVVMQSAALRDAVVAAARAWRHAALMEGPNPMQRLEPAYDQMERAVDAYEAALPGGRDERG